MKQYAIVVHLCEFETNEEGELLGPGILIEENIPVKDPDLQTVQEMFDRIDDNTFD
jgi:hypothetical protein